jgi:hypothetical protein
MSSRDEINLVALRLREAQEIDPEKAADIAVRLASADADLWQVALDWANTGMMPTEPVIHGYHARNLATVMEKPSLVFTTLLALREDASAALISLRHSPWSAAERLPS